MRDMPDRYGNERCRTRDAGGGDLGRVGWLLMMAMLAGIMVVVCGLGAPSVALADGDDPAPTTLVHPEAQLLTSGHIGEGDALLWEWFDDHTLRISGEGPIPDYDGSNQPWNQYMTLIEHVEVCEGVTRVGDYAFAGSWFLDTLWLPNGLGSIGEHAFYDARRLESADIPESVSAIGTYAFADGGLVSCHLPTQLEVIPDYMFESCQNLTTVNWPDSLATIGEYAFSETKINNISLPDTLTTLGKGAFRHVVTNASISIPGSVGTIRLGTFTETVVADRTGNIVLGEGITDIEMGAFGRTEANIIFIPASAVNIDTEGNAGTGSAFSSTQVAAFVVADDNPVFSSANGHLCSRYSRPCRPSAGNIYESKNSVLIAAASRGRNSVLDVPDGVVEICLSVISNFRLFVADPTVTMHVPATTTVGLEEIVRDDGFGDMTIDSENPEYAFSDGVLYSHDMTTIHVCSVNRSGVYVMPSTVTTIDDRAFMWCEWLTEVVISDGVTRIPSACFNRCRRIVSFYIPASVTEIVGNGPSTGPAFRLSVFDFQPISTQKIYYGGTKSEWESLVSSYSPYSAAAISLDAIKSPNVLKEFNVSCYGIWDTGLVRYLQGESSDNQTLHVERHLASDGDGSHAIPSMAADDASPWHDEVASIKEIIVGDGVAAIGDRAFSDCTSAYLAVLSESVTAIGKNAFKDCSALTDVACKGHPFDAYESSSQDCSFDADTVKLHHMEDDDSWEASVEYDSASGKWQGYQMDARCEDFLPQAVLPVLSNVTLARDTIHAAGAVSGVGRLQDIAVAVTDNAGEDIAPLVDVAISGPERTVPIEPNSGGYAVVYYDLTNRNLRVGTCALAGTYQITFSPREGEATGAPITKTLTVTRDAEKQRGGGTVGASLKVSGRRLPEGAGWTWNFYALNQYYEYVTDRCTLSVWDALGNRDITDELDQWGISVNGSSVTFGRMVVARDYRVVLTSHDPTLTGEPTVWNVPNISRMAEVINVPYSMRMTGGDSTIDVGEDGTWATKPYRTRTLDSFDDPCWPDVTWSVARDDGTDMTEMFDVDAHGYLFVKPTLRDHLEDGENLFTVTATVRDTYANCDITDSASLTVNKAPAYVPPATHEAIFVIGNEEVGRVTFTEGDTSLTEPPMPPRENYIGSWEDYDLATLTDDITIHGTYEPLDPDKVSEVEGETDASYENSIVTISLAATATTKTIRMESTRVRPVDMVLVLDQSGSMDEPLGTTGKTKQAALIECAHDFVESLYDNAAKTGADHRVALVGFGCDATNGYDYRSTGLIATTDGASFKKYARLTQSDYAKALIPIAKDGDINGIVTAGIDSVVADGATATDFGLKMASDIFSENPVGVDTETGEATRNRIVVLITDGEPTSLNPDYAECVRATSAAAIREAKGLKDGAGAKVYSVGVHADANPQAEFVAGDAGIQSKRGYIGRAITEVTTAFDFNRFLHAVSSNYPAAEGLALSDLGDGDKAGGYYMAVTDTSNLDRIFTSILYSTVYELGGFNKATLRYDLPASLAVTMRQDQEMRARLREEQGLTDEDISVEEQPDGTTRITFRNVPVRRVADDAGNVVYRAAVSFAATVLPGASGDVATGTAVIGADGSEGERVENISVDVPVDRCLLIFKVNEAIYEVREVAEGTEVTVPDTDLARWMELERLIEGGNAPVASVGAAEFATTTLTRKYNMTWVIGEQVVKESYEPGQPVTPPDGTGIIGTDQEISCWSPSAPATMPGHDMTCVATVTTKHTHSFTAGEYRTGTCTEGIVTHHVCACGAEVTEQAAPKEHSYEAIVSASSTTSETVEKLVCSDCGHSVDKHMQYQVSYSGGGWFGNAYPQYLQLNKYEHAVSANGESADDIQVRIYIPSNLANKRFTVTRIDADGNTKTYEATVGSDGYLTFYPDHFSLYYLEGLDEGEESDVPTYDEAMSAIGEGEDESSAPDVDVNAAPDGASTDDGSLDISAATADSISDQTLADGETSAEPPVTGLAYDGNPLVKGTDYEVSYEGNTEPGTAYAVVTGKGLFLGTEKRIPFTVAGSQQDDGGNNGQGNNGSGSGSGNNGGSGSQSGSGSSGNGSSGGTSSSGSGSDGGSGSSAASGIFRDVSASTPHSEDIEWAAENGISTGWTEKDGTRTFRPTNSTIRADMAAFLFRVAKRWNVVSDAWVPTDAQRKAFVDVNESTPHAKEIWWLASTGISLGWKEKDGTKTFRPYNKVVRQDMAAFLFRLAKAGRKGGATDSWKPSDTAKGKFSDVDGETSHHDEIWWLAETGVSKGWKVGDRFEFRGMEPIKRQDMAAFLRRMDGLG